MHYFSDQKYINMLYTINHLLISTMLLENANIFLICKYSTFLFITKIDFYVSFFKEVVYKFFMYDP